LYYRSFSPEWDQWRRRPGFFDQVDRALHSPLKDLPRKDLEWILHENELREVDLAARREYVDWGFTPRLRREGIGMLLPDMQGLRMTGNLLALRARLEIADHHYEKALYTLQTGYTLGRDLGDAPLLISALVGVAICTELSNQVEELIQASESPNLYWALTALPRPLVSLRKPLQGDRMIMFSELPELQNIETARFSPEQQQVLVDHVLRVIGIMHEDRTPSGANWEGKVLLAALASKLYPEAKRALIAGGRNAEEVESLPIVQVVLIHILHQFQRLQDDLYKWFNVPVWQALPELRKVDQQIVAAKSRLEGVPLLDFLPAISKVYSATGTLDRRIAALRCVEAIRMYAAAHEGKLPAALSDITEVPVPLDPMTGKGFDYQTDAQRARLSAPAVPGMQILPQDTLAYELILEH
jgi:hypothetical protein